MAYALELLFDAHADRFVRDCWSRLAQACVGEDMHKVGVMPHVALGVWESVDESRLRQTVDRVAPLCHHLTLRFSAVAVWAHTGTLFLAPTPCVRVLEVHGRVCELMRDADGQMQSYYRLGKLFPHCTLGQRIAPDDIGRAMTIGAEWKLPVTARVAGVAAVRFRPVEMIHQQTVMEQGESV
ncbi:MAG: 2'-5' RNA ligase family protein [Phycisphaeraceae bacterium]